MNSEAASKLCTLRQSLVFARPLLALLLMFTSIDATPALPRSDNAEREGESPKQLVPWVTRQLGFSIPFTVPEAGQAPMAIELFVSQNAGSSWEMVARQRPDAQSFQFQAPGEGQFWFASRTVHKHQPPPDSKQLQPELVVLVDLRQPKLHFEAKPGPNGDIVTTWEAEDLSLDPDSLLIEYLPRAGAAWKPVELQQQQRSLTQGALVGRMVWYPRTNGNSVHIRAEVSDRAGNKAVVNRLVLLSKSPTRQAPEADGWGKATTPPPDSRWPQMADHGILWPRDNRLPETENGQAASPVDGTASNVVSLPPNNLEANPPVRPPVTARFIRQRQATVEPRKNRVSLGGEQPRMTRSARFQLDYSVDAVGESGIRAVELWGTRDRGQTWTLWKNDEDRQSPMDVAVAQDGVFGFRIVVVANNGLAGTAPRNGEAADLWVGVDTEEPRASITSAMYGTGDRAGHLDIRWQATDANLGQRPISLAYSDSANGPWTTIAAEIANTGQHFWKVDARIPQRIFLRIEAEDEAGNVARYDLSESINLAGLITQARIRGMRPLP